jgi:hypothetical protein
VVLPGSHKGELLQHEYPEWEVNIWLILLQQGRRQNVDLNSVPWISSQVLY